MKTCCKCKIEKDFSLFSVCKTRKDGRNSTCKECVRAYGKIYRIKNKEYIKELGVLYRESNREILAIKRKLYYQNNRDKFAYSTKNNEYRKARRKIDPAFRAITNARARLAMFLKNKASFSKSLGCSFEIFKKYIESKFLDGMNWNNYGEWEIDHIYPLYVAYNEGQDAFISACHYTNLQPLWKRDHVEKTKSDISLYKGNPNL